MVISLIWCAGYRWLIALCLAVTFQDFTFGMTVPNRPYITVSPNPSLHGQELTMSCLPGSQLGGPLSGPPGAVVWRNDTKQLPGAVGETVTTQADAGHPSRFLCQRGGASQPLSLPFAPRVSYLLITLQSASPVDGQLMTLTCLTSDSVEKTGFRWMKWFRNDLEIEGAEARTLKIKADVANPGFFECKVFTDVVLVSYPFYPKVTPKTPRVHNLFGDLVCQASSRHAMPVYRWLKDGVPVRRETSRVLQLGRVLPIVPRHTRFACQVKEKGSSLYSKTSKEIVVRSVRGIKPIRQKEPPGDTTPPPCKPATKPRCRSTLQQSPSGSRGPSLLPQEDFQIPASFLIKSPPPTTKSPPKSKTKRLPRSFTKRLKSFRVKSKFRSFF